MGENVVVSPVPYGENKVVRISISGLRAGYVDGASGVSMVRLGQDASIVLKSHGMSTVEMSVKPEARFIDGRVMQGAQFKTFTAEPVGSVQSFYLTIAELFLKTFCQPGTGEAQVTIGKQLWKVHLNYAE